MCYRPRELCHSSQDVPSQVSRSFHKQYFQKASTALDDQELEDREFFSYTMAISKKRVVLAKQLIREFQKKLAKALETDEADDVYQVNLQFFSLTKGKNKNE